MAELGTVYVDVEGDYGKMQGQAKSKFASFGKIAAKAFVGAFVIKKAFDFGGNAIAAAEEYGTLVGGTANLIAKQQEALGSAATLTTQGIIDQSKALQTLTGMSDEQILSGQRMLLTFQGIQNEGEGQAAIFDRATEALTDLVAAEAFGDMKGGAVSLGKALQDPLKGMTALSRAGVVFTEEQKNQVAAMQESGDMVGAQSLILDELEKVYGGTAAAQKNSTDVIKNAWQDIMVVIGQQLLPILETLAAWIVDTMIPTLQEWWPTIVDTGTALVDAFKGAWEVIQPIFEAFAEVYDWVVGLFAENSEAIGSEMEETGAWLAEIWEKISKVFTLAVEAIGVVIEAALAYYQFIWDNFGEEIIATVSFIWDHIKIVIDTVLGVIEGILDTFIGIFTGDWERAKQGLLKIWSSLWEGVKGIITNAFGFLKEIVSSLGPKMVGWLGDLLGLIGGVAQAAWDGFLDIVTTMGQEAIDYVKELPGKFVEALGKMAMLLYDLGRDLIQGLINGIKGMAGSIVSAIKSFVIDKIPGPIKSFFGIGSPSKFMEQYGAWISEGMAIGIEGGAPGVTKAVDSLLANPSGSLSAEVIATGQVSPAFAVSNNFYAPVGGSMATFARDIAAEGAKELRFSYG